MNYIIKMMNGDKIKISLKTFEAIAKINKPGLIKVSELGGFINLSSVVSILEETLADDVEPINSKKTKLLFDGTNAIRIGGVWYDEDRDGVKLSLDYYHELKNKTGGDTTLLEDKIKMAIE